MSGFGWHCQKCGETRDGYMTTKWARSGLSKHRETCLVIAQEKQAAIRELREQPRVPLGEVT